MNLNNLIHPGMVEENRFTVEESHSASQIGSGDMRVLATPAMISFMEKTSHRLLMGHLPPGQSSVGIKVEVQHLAPTPLGSTVRVRSEVLHVDGLRVTFKIQAWDDQEQIGEGLHERTVIDEVRFLKRVSSKLANLRDKQT